MNPNYVKKSSGRYPWKNPELTPCEPTSEFMTINEIYQELGLAQVDPRYITADYVNLEGEEK